MKGDTFSILHLSVYSSEFRLQAVQVTPDRLKAELRTINYFCIHVKDAIYFIHNKYAVTDLHSFGTNCRYKNIA